MLWGAMVVKLIDGNIRAAAVYAFVCAAFAYFGIIHSALADGNLYLPWHLAESNRRIPNQFGAAYLGMSLIFVVLSLRQKEAAH
jgi:hypothetical protein